MRRSAIASTINCHLTWREETMKNIKAIIVATLLLLGCEHDNIVACGSMCKDSGKAMKSYSQQHGCECDGATAQEVK